MMLPLGVLSIILSIMQTSEATKSEGLTCETDYWLTISCSLDLNAIPNRSEHTSYWLEFRFTDVFNNIKVYNCSLTENEDQYTCIFKAVNLPYFPTFASGLYFAVNLSYLENGLKKSSVLDPKFVPAKHIRPINPHNLTLDMVNRSYNFKWLSGYEEHRYFTSLPLQYKFFYQKESQPGSVLSAHFLKTECSIPGHDLEAGIPYVAWVCTEISDKLDYKGVGSSCSSPIKWSTTHTGNTVGMVTLICFGAVALVFMLLCPAARMKIKKVTWVATPSPFFQSLFQNHKGNFKDWVSKGDIQITYSEEISKIDMMTEIRAEEKGLQKFSSMYSSEQYHTPYVSPAAEVWAPFQISETQSVGSISCKDLDDFLHEKPAFEEPAVLCLTMFEPITVEGFLCMDDLEFSQEDLEPPEPETTAPKPAAFPQNYCTLTNTSTGLIPTLTTGPSSPELVTDASEDVLNLQIEDNTEELVPLTLDSLQLSMDE